jgi:hypothetical protein
MANRTANSLKKIAAYNRAKGRAMAAFARDHPADFRRYLDREQKVESQRELVADE